MTTRLILAVFFGSCLAVGCGQAASTCPRSASDEAASTSTTSARVVIREDTSFKETAPQTWGDTSEDDEDYGF